MRLRCCVAFCKNTADHFSTSDGNSLSNDNGVSFHWFPRDGHRYAEWLRALGKQDAPPPESAMVCSQHFLLDDFEAGSGRQLRADAVPSTVQVCMICLASDTKMFLMSKYKLNEVYEALTGFPLFTEGNLKQTVCALCAQSLINFNRFKNKSSRACSLMENLVTKYEIVTIRHILMINRTRHQLKDNFVTTTYGPNHYDVHIHSDRQTEKCRVEKNVTVRNDTSNGLELMDTEALVKEHCNARKFCVDSSISDESIMLASMLVDDEACKVLRRTPSASNTAIKVCMTCLATDTKMFLMSKYKLKEVYETLTGNTVFNQGDIKQRVCVHCAQSLIKFNRFRDKSLRAHALILELVEKNEIITIRHIKMINRTKHKLNDNFVSTTLGPDHCNLHILDRQIVKLKNSVHREEESVTVRDKRSNGPELKDPEEVEKSISDESIMQALKQVDDELCKALEKTQAASSSAVTKHASRTKDRTKINISSSITCVLCFEEFSSERDHLAHMTWHLQNTGNDGERDAPQVCEPGTSASCSRGSSHDTQNKSVSIELSDDRQTIASSVRTYVSPAIARRAKINKVHTAAEENNTTQVNIEINDALENLLPDSLKVSSIDHVLNNSINTILVEDEFPTDSRNAINSGDGQNINVATKYCKDQAASLKSQVSATQSSSRSVKSNAQPLSSPDKPFSCHLCDFRYRENHMFVRHMTKHTGEKLFRCTICDYKCNYKCSLVVHMRTHSAERPFPCQLCEYTSKTKHHLNNHMRTHTGIKPFACRLCDSKFRKKCHLERHMSTHTGEKPFPCKICNLKFSRKEHATKHMATHTGEKPFSCDSCNRAFTQKYSLEAHIKSNRCGKKTFTCDMCNHKFAQKKYVARHIMKYHTSAKTFSCHLCLGKFANRNTLVTHIRTKRCKKRFS